MTHRLLTVLLTLSVTLGLQGCVLVPFITAFKQTGVTEEDRMALLAPEVKKYTDALARGSKTGAMMLVDDESRVEMSKQLRGLGEEERIVESKIDEVEWSDSAFTAKVYSKMKFFKVPYYVVKTRLEEQVWTFSVASGWKLKERKIVEES